MPAKITLTVTNGRLQGEQYLFEERTTCIMGRAEDCYIRLPSDEYHSNVSRYHCLLDINPPQICIRDFGSKNGTYVNGSIIGQRKAHQTPEEATNFTFPEYDLGTGDEIQLGDTVLCVAIETEGNAIPVPVETIIQQEEPATSKGESHQGKTYSVPHHLLHSPQPPSNRSKFFKLIQDLLKRAMGGDETLKQIKHYTMERKLGQGGFGEVYLARHTLTNKQVALKVMQPAVAAEQWAIDRFQREIENTKALNHPNIIQLLEHGFADGLFFFTMEYCNGGTIGELISQQGGRLPIQEALSLIFPVLDGLAYAHTARIPHVQKKDGTIGEGKGLVHRDIKPQNIYLLNRGATCTVKVGDYGLSKAFDLAGLSGLSMSGDKIGSYEFMPRQQATNFKYVQPEVDVWAAAATLYYMLTGSYPRDFKGKDPLLAILKDKPVPLRQRDSSIPERLAEVVDLALVETPKIYFDNAAVFKQALENVV